MAYAKFRSDNLAGTTLGKYLASVRLPEDLENGCFVELGGYELGQREVRSASKPSANTPLSKVGIIGSEEVVKEKTYDTVGGFINKKDDIARVYILSESDIFSVTDGALKGEEPAVGLLVCLDNDYKAVVTEDAGEATVIGTIVAIEGEWVVINVSAA